jgi:hypothetical protein
MSRSSSDDGASRHPSQIPLSIFIPVVIACTAVTPNFDQPFVSYAFAGSALFLYLAPARLRDWISATALGLSFCIFHLIYTQATIPTVRSLSLYAGMFGRGAMVVLGWRTIWASTALRPRLITGVGLSIGIVAFVVASLLALNLTSTAHTQVLDAYLYAFDGSLGFQPSFLIGRLFLRCKILDAFARTSYLALPLAIALICAAHWMRASPWRPLTIMVSAGVFGYFLYWTFPAAGPVYFAGAAFPQFPGVFDVRAMQPHPLLLSVRAPHNAMPSLHMAWALLLWLNCRTFSRSTRGVAFAYVVLTLLATLGTGEHYLIDLVVAIPFALGIQSLWTPASTKMRYIVLATGAGWILIWLIVLRYATSIFFRSPAVPWISIACTTVSCGIAQHFLNRESELPA